MSPSMTIERSARVGADDQPPDRATEAQRIAGALFQQDPDWVTFFREVLGVSGVVQKLFASTLDRAEFEQSRQYAAIQRMLAALRERRPPAGPKEPTRVITIRLPESLHQSLRLEAFDRHTSMNQLCISKLLHVLADDLPVQLTTHHAPLTEEASHVA